jgi:hypothetical protein
MGTHDADRVEYPRWSRTTLASSVVHDQPAVADDVGAVRPGPASATVPAYLRTASNN